MKKCEYCGREIPFREDYLVYQPDYEKVEKYYCENCFEEEQITVYFIGGEFVGEDGDGYEKVYAYENVEGE